MYVYQLSKIMNLDLSSSLLEIRQFFGGFSIFSVVIMRQWFLEII